nr:SJCHGC04464 protein [Schistosoma japonicum]
MGNSLNSSRELNSDGNSRQIGDWNQSASMTNIDDGVEDENYGNDDDDDDDFIESRSQQDKCPTYIDEETRFSIGTSEIPISITDRPSHLDYSQSNLNDDLVAKDLQLTDSDDDDSCLSGQGGELCADSDTAIIPYNINEDEQETALNDAPQCTEYNPNDSEIVSHSFSTYEQQHRRQNDQDNINNDRPTFFISDDDD